MLTALLCFIIYLAADQVDLITSFVTFHHVSQIEEALSELVRILRLGGYLILREHDCKTEQSLSAKYLHFVHAIMMIARVGEFASSAKDGNDESDYLPSEDSENNTTDWQEQKSRIIDYTKTIHYRTSDEWQKKLENVGFRLCATLSYGTNEASNPQKLFYAVYQLINKW
jgi:ubiquinone/menaquinone biosynthesis C-methylase UbiE